VAVKLYCDVISKPIKFFDARAEIRDNIEQIAGILTYYYISQFSLF